MEKELIAQITLDRNCIKEAVYEVLAEIGNQHTVVSEGELGGEAYYNEQIHELQSQIKILQAENATLKKENKILLNGDFQF